MKMRRQVSHALSHRQDDHGVKGSPACKLMALDDIPVSDSDAENAALLEPAHKNGTSGATEPETDENHEAELDAAYFRLRKGFFAYSVASEIVQLVTLSLFLPVILEQYARENGKLAPGFTVPCPGKAEDGPSEGEEAVRCSVQLGWYWMDTASFALFVYSMSVLTQALVVISLGGLANEPFTRHRLLVAFASLGSATTVLFFFLRSDSPLWPLAGLCAIIMNVTFGLGGVINNSFLGEIGRNAPSSRKAWAELQKAREASYVATAEEEMQEAGVGPDADVQAALAHYDATKARATSLVSARAIAAGYTAGIAALVLLLVPVTMAEGSVRAMQSAIGASGLAWAAGSVPAFVWLRPAEVLHGKRRDMEPIRVGRSIKEGWLSMGRMLKEWRRLPNTFIFLSAWFLLSDAFATMTSAATLFAKTTLSMSTQSLIVIGIIGPLSGIVGALFFPRLQHSFKKPELWDNLGMLRLLVIVALVVPLYGLFGLRSKAEMYPVAIWFGACYGSFQSYSRSTFSELVPHAQAGAWFGLYSITDKSSSFLGPLGVAVLTDKTGNIRNGFYVVVTMMFIALVPLRFVAMQKGRADAERFSGEETAAV